MFSDIYLLQGQNHSLHAADRVLKIQVLWDVGMSDVGEQGGLQQYQSNWTSKKI